MTQYHEYQSLVDKILEHEEKAKNIMNEMRVISENIENDLKFLDSIVDIQQHYKIIPDALCSNIKPIFESSTGTILVPEHINNPELCFVIDRHIYSSADMNDKAFFVPVGIKVSEDSDKKIFYCGSGGLVAVADDYVAFLKSSKAYRTWYVSKNDNKEEVEIEFRLNFDGKYELHSGRLYKDGNNIVVIAGDEILYNIQWLEKNKFLPANVPVHNKVLSEFLKLTILEVGYSNNSTIGFPSEFDDGFKKIQNAIKELYGIFNVFEDLEHVFWNFVKKYSGKSLNKIIDPVSGLMEEVIEHNGKQWLVKLDEKVGTNISVCPLTELENYKLKYIGIVQKLDENVIKNKQVHYSLEYTNKDINVSIQFPIEDGRLKRNSNQLKPGLFLDVVPESIQGSYIELLYCLKDMHVKMKMLLNWGTQNMKIGVYTHKNRQTSGFYYTVDVSDFLEAKDFNDFLNRLFSSEFVILCPERLTNLEDKDISKVLHKVVSRTVPELAKALNSQNIAKASNDEIYL